MVVRSWCLKTRYYVFAPCILKRESKAYPDKCGARWVITSSQQNAVSFRLVAGFQTPNAIELRDRSNDCNDIVTLCNVWYACIVTLKAFAFEWMDVENWRVECNFDLALVSAFPKVSRRCLCPSLKIWCSSEVWDNAACLWYLKMLMMICIIKGTYY